VGQWFIAPRNSPVGSPLLSSIIVGRTLRYHLGTVFFGSALIAAVQLARMVVQGYLYMVSRGSESNSAVLACRALAGCCLGCLQRFVDAVNKNAYVQTAIEGTGFCASAGNAFQLLLRNALRLAAVAGITTLLLGICKVCVAATTGFVCALIIVGGDINNVVSAPVFSVTVVGVRHGGVAASAWTRKRAGARHTCR
jgi:hypothetical protein